MAHSAMDLGSGDHHVMCTLQATFPAKGILIQWNLHCCKEVLKDMYFLYIYCT